MTPPSDFMLERAASLLITAQQWHAALGLFSLIAHHYPKKASSWFGIGSTLRRLRKPELLPDAVAALKRSREVSDERTTRAMLRDTETDARAAGLNPDDIRPYRDDPYPYFANRVQFNAQTLIDGVRALEWDQRSQIVTFLGEQPGPLFDALIADLSTNDPNTNVRRAAEAALKVRPAPAVVDVLPTAEKPLPDVPTEVEAQSSPEQHEPPVDDAP